MSLIAWYPLIANGNNQGLDGINLETIGTIPYKSGKLGNAASFSANLSNYFRRPQIKINDNFSFACWYKLNSTESTTWQTLFFEGRDVNSDGWGFRINGSNKRVIFCCGSSSYTYGTDLTIGTWHHVCMTIKNAVWTAYVDGNQVGTGSITILPALTEWGTYFFVGCLSNNYYPLNGQVQDIRIYDHPLSKKEVKELAKGLCLHLPLDWGGNPNMIKNSYTWMNKNTGSNNQWTNSGLTYDSSTVTENDIAPCRWVMKRVITNTKTSNVGGAGCFYGIDAKGLATTDLIENEYYTYSFWAKSDSGVSSGFSAGSVVEGQTLVSNTSFGALNGNWRLHTVTFKFTKTTSLTNCFYVTVPASSTVDFQLCGLKLEKGQKATPYLPNVEEAIYTTDNYGNIYKEDVSGYGYNSTATNCTSYSSTPRGLTSTDFTAKTSHIPIPKIWNSCTEFSTSIWVKFDSDTLTTSSNNTSNVIALGSNEFFRYRLTNTGKGIWVYWNNGAKFTYTQEDSFIDNNWHHVVTTWKASDIVCLYIDGVLKYSVATTLTSLTAVGNWKLGEYENNTETMDGQLSDFRLYATALSADDVKELYQVGAQIDKSGNFYCGTLVEV